MTGTLRALFCAAIVAFASPAGAQSYPERPIRMIVSIAAGSVTDVIMRAAANELQPRLKQTLVIENQGGAAGILGGQACARATPDGYTICVIYHSTMSYNPLLFTKLPYNADTDFAPVARLFFLTEGLFASSALGVNIGRRPQGEGAVGRGAQLRDAGRRLVPRPVPEMDEQPVEHQDRRHSLSRRRTGGAGARRQRRAGDALRRRQFHRPAGKRQGEGFGIGLPERSALFPDVPTLDEAGLPGFPGQGWWGLAAPRGTPPAIVERLSSEFGKLFSEPKFKAFLDKQAVASAPTTPDGFAAFLKQDRKAAETLIRIANTKPEEYTPGK